MTHQLILTRLAKINVLMYTAPPSLQETLAIEREALIAGSRVWSTQQPSQASQH